MDNLLNDHVALGGLHSELWQLVGLINDETNVPARYTSDLRGIVADQDYRNLVAACSTLHRLKLWAQYPDVSPERYTTASA